ncbi:hypothetical protein B0J12DRAFT_280633 [Macrophomina phaseolina]|uniref:Uncharacterized protein n=1 Tax=Macrophomina phaseolina TaxID=35725 RepID=A0ABQ8GMU7_9PEZI|nr:hypothetical protein B0J12DRAFT_280633 [Macrophomina phaseolina]
MSVRPSKRAGLVPSRCASVWHPGLFQGRYCPPPTACRHPGLVRSPCISSSSSSRQGASAGLQHHSRPPGSASPLPRHSHLRPSRAPPRAMGACAPRRRSAPPQQPADSSQSRRTETKTSTVDGWTQIACLSPRLRRQSGSSTAHVDGGAPHVYSRPRNCLSRRVTDAACHDESEADGAPVTRPLTRLACVASGCQVVG